MTLQPSNSPNALFANPVNTVTTIAAFLKAVHQVPTVLSLPSSQPTALKALTNHYSTSRVLTIVNSALVATSAIGRTLAIFLLMVISISAH